MVFVSFDPNWPNPKDGFGQFEQIGRGIAVMSFLGLADFWPEFDKSIKKSIEFGIRCWSLANRLRGRCGCSGKHGCDLPAY